MATTVTVTPTTYSFDLRWHLGNVLTLLVIARRLGRQRGMPELQIRQMLDDMKSGNYDNLLDALERWLPGTFVFKGDPRRGQNSHKRYPLDCSIPPAFDDLVDGELLGEELQALDADGLLKWPSRSKRAAAAA